MHVVICILMVFFFQDIKPQLDLANGTGLAESLAEDLLKHFSQESVNVKQEIISQGMITP